MSNFPQLLGSGSRDRDEESFYVSIGSEQDAVQDVEEVISKQESSHLQTKPKTCGQIFCSYAGTGCKLFGAAACKIVTFSWVRDCVRGVYRTCVRKPDREVLLEGYQDAVAANFRDVLPFRGTYRDVDSESIHQFQRRLESLDVFGLSKDPERMRRTIVSLSKHPGYEALRCSGRHDHPAVRYLQDLGVKLESANARKAFQEYGLKRSGKYLHGNRSVTCSYSALVEGTSSAQRNFSSHRDTGCGTLWWGRDHLGYVAHVESAHLWEAGYDSYQNQTVFMGDTLIDDGHSIDIKFTPGLTGPNSIVEDVLIPAYRDRGQRWIFVSNQSMHKRDERARINMVQGWAEEHSDTFRQAVLSTDICKQKQFKALLKEFKSGRIDLAQYFNAFEGMVRGTNSNGRIDDSLIRSFARSVGYYIPIDLLSGVELQAAFNAARNMILNNPQNALFTPEELADVVRRTVASVLTWTIMKKEQLTHQGSKFTVACKENIDRGPMAYLELRGNEMMCQNQTELPADEAEFISGVVLGRAHLAMDRPPQRKRMEPVLTRSRYFRDPLTFGCGYRELQAIRSLILSSVQRDDRRVEVAASAHAVGIDRSFEHDSKEEKNNAPGVGLGVPPEDMIGLLDGSLVDGIA